ncbi:hypothetical protein A6F68_00898 [Tsuneonella dongtanensis]|uniref:Uncharacterized protein n=1 Tax=Tsuneonella dongtanensis TaxID=692370 RepID=A0A1B2ABD8_9SPHN|nr:hypothetical protein [Tsuneonella dongtanensis]ANY19424.1 hypothetical protein A6F68_00898 [Tsuneonella dongtanensis]
MINDYYHHVSDSLTAPARQAFSVTPHDSNDLPQVPKAIYVGNGGSIALRPIGSNEDVTFVNVQDGTILDIRARAVRATGTTASGIVGLA